MGKPEANSLVAVGDGNQLVSKYCPKEMVGVLYGEVTERLGLGPAYTNRHHNGSNLMDNHLTLIISHTKTKSNTR